MTAVELDPGFLGQSGGHLGRALPLPLKVEREPVGVSEDQLTLSPKAQQLGAAVPGEDAVVSDGKDIPAAAENFIFSALNSLRNDLSQLLAGFGITGEAQKNFSDAFVGPALDALKSGVDFSADLSLQAFSQVTRISGASFSQVTDLVTRSLEIDVNRTTGEVSVALASLSVHQEVHRGGAPSPLLSIGSGGIAGQPSGGGGEEESPIEQLLREASEALIKEVQDFISDIDVTAVDAYRDDAGDEHIKLTINAATPVSGDPKSEPEATSPLELTA